MNFKTLPSFFPKFKRFLAHLAPTAALLSLLLFVLSKTGFSLGLNRPQIGRLTLYLVILAGLVNLREIKAIIDKTLAPKAQKRFVLLTLANIALTLIFIIGYSIFQYGSPLIYENHPQGFKTAKEMPLVEETTITQEFTADSNNLGTVGVKLSVQEKILGFNEEREIVEIKPEEETEEEIIDQETQEEQLTDKGGFPEEEGEALEEIAYYQPAEIIFRLKEKGAGEWFYENSYFFNQTVPAHFYPFGFPVIENSKDKTYLVEIEGQKEIIPEEKELYLFTSVDKSNNPYLYSRYVYNKGELRENIGPILENFSRKLALLIKNKELVAIIITHSIFSFVLIFTGFLKKKMFEKLVKWGFWLSLLSCFTLPFLKDQLPELLLGEIFRSYISLLSLLLSGILVLINRKSIKEETYKEEKKEIKKERDEKYYPALLIAIILIGIFLRLNHIKNLSIWYDEGISISVAQNIAKGNGHTLINGNSYNRAYLYHEYLGWFYKISDRFHVGIYANIPFYIITSVFLYLFGEELLHKKTGLFAVFLFAFSWVGIAMAREIRFYEMFVCLFTMGNYFLYKAIKKYSYNKTGFSFLACSAMSMAFFYLSLKTQELTFFIFYPITLFALVMFIKSRKKFLPILFFSLLFIILGNVSKYKIPIINIKYYSPAWVHQLYDNGPLRFFIELVTNYYFYISLTFGALLLLVFKKRNISTIFLFSTLFGLYFILSLQGISDLSLLRYYYFLFPFIFLSTAYIIFIFVKKTTWRFLINIFLIIIVGITLFSGLQESSSPLTLTSKYEHKNLPYHKIVEITDDKKYQEYKIVGDHSFSLVYFLITGSKSDYYLIRENKNKTYSNETHTGTTAITYKDFIDLVRIGEKIIFVYDERNYKPIKKFLVDIIPVDSIVFEQALNNKKEKIYVIKIN